MDWRFVDDERWRDIIVTLNGAGVESMQAKWEEMFGEESSEKKEEVKVKKPRKKAAVKAKTEGDLTSGPPSEKKTRVRKTTDPTPKATKRTTRRKAEDSKG
jgi:hypothetical protein